MTDTKENLEKLLEAGKLSRARLYQTLLGKISNGEALKSTELRILTQLEAELEKETAGPELPEVFPSMAAAARYAGVSRNTVKHHADKGMIQVLPDGTIPRKSMDDWIAQRGSDGRGGDRRKKKDEKPEAKKVILEKTLADLRYKLAKAEKEELFVAQLKGTMVPWEEIEKEWASRVAVVTAGLTALAERLPPLLAGKSRAKMQEVIREEIWRIRDDYARAGKYCPNAKG